jgi:hypothetical protein
LRLLLGPVSTSDSTASGSSPNSQEFGETKHRSKDPNSCEFGYSGIADGHLTSSRSCIMKISIPNLSLVVLIGPSGSGKSTFARKHFLPSEVLSSDACRGMVSDDENNQAVTNEAFALLHYIAAQRLALGRLTVIDATNVQPEARKPLVELARKYHRLSPQRSAISQDFLVGTYCPRRATIPHWTIQGRVWRVLAAGEPEQSHWGKGRQ